MLVVVASGNMHLSEHAYVIPIEVVHSQSTIIISRAKDIFLLNEML